MMVQIMQDDVAGGMLEAMEKLKMEGTEEEQRARDSGCLIEWGSRVFGVVDDGGEKSGGNDYGEVVFDAETNAYVFK